MKDLAAEYAVDHDKKGEIVHSSGYAIAQSGEVIGVSSAQSFAERRAIDANRRNIRKYSDSRIASQAMANGPRAKVYTPPDSSNATQAPRQLPKREFSRGRNLSPRTPGVVR